MCIYCSSSVYAEHEEVSTVHSSSIELRYFEMQEGTDIVMLKVDKNLMWSVLSRFALAFHGGTANPLLVALVPQVRLFFTVFLSCTMNKVLKRRWT